MRRIGLRKKDAADRCRWREGVERVAKNVKSSKLHPATFLHWWYLNWIKIELMITTSACDIAKQRKLP